jgi:hypothetical protein
MLKKIIAKLKFGSYKIRTSNVNTSKLSEKTNSDQEEK